MTNTASGGFGPMQGVPKGVGSVILNNQTVPVFDAAGSGVGRTLLFRYRMIDSSSKTASYNYN